MASISYSYRSPKERARIEARFSFKQDDIFYSQRTRVKLEVSKSFWKDYQQGKNFRDVAKANLKTDLDIHLAELEDFILQEYHLTAPIAAGWLSSTVKGYYNPKTDTSIPEDLAGYWEYYMKFREKELKSKYRTWQKWSGTKNKIERFQKDAGKIYMIWDINDEFKKAFVDWCLLQSYAVDTIKRDLTTIKAVGTHAGIKGIKTSPELPNIRSTIKAEKLPKVYLSFEDLDKIAAVDGITESLNNARDWLLISCFTGQRISDFMRFTPGMVRVSNDRKYIDLKQVKTGKNITVPLMPEVEKILQKHTGNFPRPISHQRYNDYIKEVCKLAGINQPMKGKVSTMTKVNGKKVKRGISGTYEKWQLIGSHAGRRSFATNYYGKIPTTYLKNITGHSTEAMLLNYIGKTSKDTAAEAYDLLINSKR